MARKTEFERMMEDLSSKVRSALGVLIGTNTTLYVAPADVAEHILSSSSALSEDEREELVRRVGALLSTMNRKGNCDIYRTDHKIQPKAVNRKAQYGYRIGPCLTPIRTTEVRLQEKMTADMVASATEDPIEFLLSIKGQLPLLKLNALMVEICGEIQNRVMEQHVAMSQLDKRMKELSEDFKSLSGVTNAEEAEPVQEQEAVQGRSKKKARG